MPFLPLSLRFGEPFQPFTGLANLPGRANLQPSMAHDVLAGSTALPDTFGTEGFVKMALVTRVPKKFIEDMQANFPHEPPIPEGMW